MNMKTRKLKRIGCMMAALCMLFLECASVSAKEMPAAKTVAPVSALSRMAEFNQCDTDGDGLVYGIVSVPSIQPLAAQNGEVMDNGVRLRNKASTSGTILELMYKGEAVSVNITISTTVSGWYYLKRLKTGTWGWAKADYIYYYH